MDAALPIIRGGKATVIDCVTGELKSRKKTDEESDVAAIMALRTFRKGDSARRR
jgi:hypothetical protein